MFGREAKIIDKHINNVLKEKLGSEVVVAKFETTNQHGAIEGKKQTHNILKDYTVNDPMKEYEIFIENVLEQWRRMKND